MLGFHILSLYVSKVCSSCRQLFYFHVDWAYKPGEQVLNISFEAGVPKAICCNSPHKPWYFIQPDDTSVQDKGGAKKVISDGWNPTHRLQVPWLQDAVSWPSSLCIPALLGVWVAISVHKDRKKDPSLKKWMFFCCLSLLEWLRAWAGEAEPAQRREWDCGSVTMSEVAMEPRLGARIRLFPKEN